MDADAHLARPDLRVGEVDHLERLGPAEFDHTHSLHSLLTSLAGSREPIPNPADRQIVTRAARTVPGGPCFRAVATIVAGDVSKPGSGVHSSDPVP